VGSLASSGHPSFARHLVGPAMTRLEQVATLAGPPSNLKTLKPTVIVTPLVRSEFIDELRYSPPPVSHPGGIGP
jgi:hypothetical protein